VPGQYLTFGQKYGEGDFLAGFRGPYVILLSLKAGFCPTVAVLYCCLHVVQFLCLRVVLLCFDIYTGRLVHNVSYAFHEG